MRGVNLVMFAGNLGGDPDLRYLQSGSPVASFNLAVNEKWKGNDGEWKEKTEWIKVVAFSAIAEACGKYLSKGDEALVIGRLRTREYEDRDKVARRVTEVVADRVHFLSMKKKNEEGGDNNNGKREKPAENPPYDDDVPF